MNWTQIKEKHPKAWGSLIFFIGMRYGMSTEIGGKSFLVLYGSSGEYRDNMPFPIRDLYDFFDEQGIIGSVSKDSEEINCWIVDVLEKMDEVVEGHRYRQLYDELCYADCRTDVEHYLFEKEFEILENRINK